MTEVAKKVEEFKNDTKKEAEKLVKDVFPRKVLQLNDMLKLEIMHSKRLGTLKADLNIPVPEPVVNNHDSDEPQAKRKKVDSLVNNFEVSGSKVYSLPNGTAPANKKLTELIDMVRPCIIDLIEHANMIKMWITYSIPRIEDGNNFGVSIQEDTMAEARQVETEAATYLDQIARYHITRAKIVSKVAKYPHVEDYRRSVDELDEKEFVSLRLVICELRNHYASLHDIITKNLDKIKKPRTSNADSLY